jgi:hypothetical protein
MWQLALEQLFCAGQGRPIGNLLFLELAPFRGPVSRSHGRRPLRGQLVAPAGVVAQEAWPAVQAALAMETELHAESFCSRLVCLVCSLARFKQTNKGSGAAEAAREAVRPPGVAAGAETAAGTATMAAAGVFCCQGSGRDDEELGPPPDCPGEVSCGQGRGLGLFGQSSPKSMISMPGAAPASGHKIWKVPRSSLQFHLTQLVPGRSETLNLFSETDQFGHKSGCRRSVALLDMIVHVRIRMPS